LIASIVAAIAGTGGGIILLPVLVAVFGVREAIPMYAVAQLIGNLSRVTLNRQLVLFPVVFWFCVGAIPFSILGAWLFTKLPDSGLLKILGAFLIFSVMWRHWRGHAITTFSPQWFTPIGAVFSVISAIVGSAGPFLAPFYLSYGLVKGAFIGTEALGTAAMHIVKLASYQGLGAISPAMWLNGVLVGPVMIVGSLVGKSILERLSTQVFMIIIEVAIIGFGLWFLIK
jgi:uncharacterized membrane protein YfcA